MNQARMWGAWLVYAQLQGASLDWAELQGARLSGSHLEGASLRYAQLQGASLDDAQLQAASLEGAQLQGASLRVAELQGASLVRARLLGALFDEAGLQGASLDGAEMRGASFSHVLTWRSDVRSSQSEGALVVAPETRPRDRRFDCPNYEPKESEFGYGGSSFAAAKLGVERKQQSWPPSLSEKLSKQLLKRICPDYKESPADWSAESFAALKAQIEEQVPTGRRATALKRIAILDPATPRAGEEAMGEAWNDLARSRPEPEIYEKTAETLINVGCERDTGPYVVTNSFIELPSHFPLGNSQPRVVAAAFLDQTHCPAARDMPESVTSILRQYLDRAPAPTAPNQ